MFCLFSEIHYIVLLVLRMVEEDKPHIVKVESNARAFIGYHLLPPLALLAAVVDALDDEQGTLADTDNAIVESLAIMSGTGNVQQVYLLMPVQLVLQQLFVRHSDTHSPGTAGRQIAESEAIGHTHLHNLTRLEAVGQPEKQPADPTGIVPVEGRLQKA